MMHIHIFDDFSIKKLEVKEIPVAKMICDRYVGKGMYSTGFFCKIILQENHFFYLVYKNEEVVGYFYGLSLLRKDVSELPGLKDTTLNVICGENDMIGICRSIGIDEQYRGTNLSDCLLRYFTKYLFEAIHVCAIFIPAWVKGSYIPAKRLLEENEYRFLCDLYKPWINSSQLQCPYCKKERCICDAVIYYMKEETYFEKRKTFQT